MKDLDQIGIMAKAEMGFIKMIVQPLWSLVNMFLDQAIPEIIENLEKNSASWEKIYLDSSNDPQKRSFLTKMQEDHKEGSSELPNSSDGTGSPKEEGSGSLKRSKSLFSTLKKSVLKSPDKAKE